MGTDSTYTRLQLLGRQAVASPGNSNISFEPGTRPKFWSQHHKQTSTVDVKVWRHFGNEGVLDTADYDADKYTEERKAADQHARQASLRAFQEREKHRSAASARALREERERHAQQAVALKARARQQVRELNLRVAAANMGKSKGTEVEDAHVLEGPHMAQQATILLEGRRPTSTSSPSAAAQLASAMHAASIRASAQGQGVGVAWEGDGEGEVGTEMCSMSTYSLVPQQGSVEDGDEGAEGGGEEGDVDGSSPFATHSIAMDFSFGVQAHADSSLVEGAGAGGGGASPFSSPERAAPHSTTHTAVTRVSGALQPTPAPRPPPSLMPHTSTPPSGAQMGTQRGGVSAARGRESAAADALVGGVNPARERVTKGVTTGVLTDNDVHGSPDQYTAGAGYATATGGSGGGGGGSPAVLGVGAARLRLLRHCGRAAGAQAMQRAAAAYAPEAADQAAAAYPAQTDVEGAGRGGAGEGWQQGRLHAGPQLYGQHDASSSAAYLHNSFHQEPEEPRWHELQSSGAGDCWVVDSRPSEPIVSRVMAHPPRGVNRAGPQPVPQTYQGKLLPTRLSLDDSANLARVQQKAQTMGVELPPLCSCASGASPFDPDYVRKCVRNCGLYLRRDEHESLLNRLLQVHNVI